MKIYIKGFYGYKNFGDEVLLFGLLNYLQKTYNPESFTVEAGDKARIEYRTQTNHQYLDTGILDKLEFIEKSQTSNKFLSKFIKRIKQTLNILGFDPYKNHFKVFGGGEVLDESRPFPHNGRNLPILYFRSIIKKQFILVGGIGYDQKKSTKYLYKYLLPKAQKIICREEESISRAKKYVKNNSKLLKHLDFSNNIFDVNNDLKSSHKYQQNTILINIGPKYFTPQNIKKIKKFISGSVEDNVILSHKNKIIFFPADLNYDKQYYSKLRQEIPELEIYDRTKHPLSETIDLFKSCNGGVGSRLHFLYPLKIFKKDFLSISSSDKVKKMI